MNAVRLRDKATLPFNNVELANLLMALPTGRHGQQEVDEFLELLEATDLSLVGDGNEIFQQQMKKGAHLKNNYPSVSLATALRAHPFEVKELILWAHGKARMPADSTLLEFYSMFGLLNERATRPVDFIYQATGIEVPEPLNRTLSPRQEALATAQKGFWEPQ